MDIYVVSYVDDYNKKHITFVRGYASISFFKERFGKIFFEPVNDPFVEEMKEENEENYYLI